MSRRDFVAAVAGAIGMTIVGLYQAHVGAAKVESAEVQCGELIVAIVGQFKPAEGE